MNERMASPGIMLKSPVSPETPCDSLMRSCRSVRESALRSASSTLIRPAV